MHGKTVVGTVDRIAPTFTIIHSKSIKMLMKTALNVTAARFNASVRPS
jgi:hypothetical protein